MAEVETRRRLRIVLIALLALVAAVLLALWLARRPIATNVIDRELARRGVPARYEVKRIGFRTQRIEGLSIGDPRAPDLTAEWVEVDLRPTLGAPEVRAVRAGGVRLRARIDGGRVRLGAVERLLPKPTGAPFRLPDLPVELADARIALATPAGPVQVRLDGRGNLANGFAGRYLARAPALDLGGCTVTSLRTAGRVTTAAARPRFAGPLAAEGLGCTNAGFAALSGSLDATLEPGLDGWRGQAGLASEAARVADWRAEGARGQIDFAGTATRTAGELRLAGLAVAGPAGSAGRAELGGRYVVETGREERLDVAAAPATSLRFEGGLSADRVVLAAAPRLDGVAASVAGTPLEPLARAFARAAEGMSRSGGLRASLSLAQRGDRGSLRIANAELAGGGARLAFSGGEGVRLVWPGVAQPQLDGRLVLTGQGVPRIVAELRQAGPGVSVSGFAQMAPFVADVTRVALAPVRFEGGRFTTAIEASGPLLGGRVEQARLPLAGRIGPGGLVLNPGCAPLSFRDLTVSGLDLEPATLRLCPAGPALVANGRVAGTIEAPRLRGTLGQSPITLTASRARFDGSAFRIAELSARLGEERVSRLDVAELSGRPGPGVGGRFAGASGQIGDVPLIVSGAAGQWRYAGGLLTVSGGLTLTDAADPDRFQPLRSNDLALSIRGNDVRATAALLEPQTGARVAGVTLRHDLGAGRGSADIDVAGLRFTPDGLQPEQVTRLALGVIAEVDGTLSGNGRIAWTPEGVSSTGLFDIEAASLAAPFGPATGVRTQIRFTDLLGLVTAPDQRLTVATVNPGILVEEGVVRYRLVPGLKVAIDDARWPFAGGLLTLRPTVLDFSEEAARELTFDIAGLDAAKFVNKLEFSNINATGTFDGVLPMVFDQDGGRMVGGRLESRPDGGTLAYIGQVSNADLGIWGGIAFDALKSIQYQNMTIALDGRIDGEMVSQIRFAGVSRGTIQPVATGLIARVGGQLASELQRIPFIFNIRITAPFRGLIAMSRSFDDPTFLIQDQLGPQFEAVQPLSSEDKP
jgi:translocation and assembly module TamB